MWHIIEWKKDKAVLLQFEHEDENRRKKLIFGMKKEEEFNL